MWPFRTKRGQNQTFQTSNISTAARGARGERLARKHLRRAKLKILATNYRCPVGEIDIIALDRRAKPETIVFVEVKTRNSDRYTSPASAVNHEKQNRIRKVANYYLRAKRAQEYRIRFDIVSIVLPDTGPDTIEHIPDAF